MKHTNKANQNDKIFGGNSNGLVDIEFSRQRFSQLEVIDTKTNSLNKEKLRNLQSESLLKPTRVSVYTSKGTTKLKPLERDKKISAEEEYKEFLNRFEVDFKSSLNHAFYTQDDLVLPTKLENFVDASSHEFKYKLPQYFVFSQAGKPIYTRFGNENDLAETAGIFQAIISNLKVIGENLKFIKTNDQYIGVKVTRILYYAIILRKEHLRSISDDSLIKLYVEKQLRWLCMHVDSVVPEQTLDVFYKDNYGANINSIINRSMIDCLTTRINSIYPAFVFDAFVFLEPENSNKTKIKSAIEEAIKESNTKGESTQTLIETWFVARKYKLLCLANLKPNQSSLSETITLIMNTLNYGKTFQSYQQIWFFPMWLPQISADYFTHVFVTRLQEDHDFHLVLLTLQKSKFEDLIRIKEEIIQRTSNIIKGANLNMKNSANEFGVGIPGLRHFMILNNRKTNGHVSMTEYDSAVINERILYSKIFNAYVYFHYQLCFNSDIDVGNKWFIECFSDITIVVKVFHAKTLYSAYSHLLNSNQLKAKCFQIMDWDASRH